MLSKAIFVVIGVLSFLLLTPWPRARQAFLSGLLCGFLGLFTRVWLPLMRAYRIVEISGRDLIESCRPAVIVANHRSFMDSIFLLGLSPRTGALTKDKHARQPIYYLLVRYYDLVSVDRESLESVRAAFARCRQLLAAGKNLVVFPEGTRARSGRLQPFNRFAFDLALAAGVPVLPVVIHSTEAFMGKMAGSAFPRRRNFFRIRFLDPEPLRAGDDGDSLRDRVHRRLAQELKLLDVGTGWEMNPHKP
ncbi:MAG TPA: lysophospholipid acyltransferase family protein [Verrucomicrobiae bacterium]|nr:lysophospholipid acyltransferase family protein [Verrucomicrobiae bacterium]